MPESFTTAQWKDLLTPLGLNDFFRDTVIPTELNDIFSNDNWDRIFYAYAQIEFNAENLDFLREVAKFEASGDLNLAAEIYTKFVSEDAPTQVNLQQFQRVELENIFGPGKEGIGPPNLFDTSKAEIRKLVHKDSFARFRKTGEPAQREMARAMVAAASEVDTETDWDNIGGRDHADAVSAAGAADVDNAADSELRGLTLDFIDDAAVLALNQEEMKKLVAVGDAVDFVQSGDYLLLGAGHHKLYYPLLGQQAGVCKGSVRMFAKGGAFSSGEVRVIGSNDQAKFKTAMQELTKKKVSFG